MAKRPCSPPTRLGRGRQAMSRAGRSQEGATWGRGKLFEVIHPTRSTLRATAQLWPKATFFTSALDVSAPNACTRTYIIIYHI